MNRYSSFTALWKFLIIAFLLTIVSQWSIHVASSFIWKYDRQNGYIKGHETGVRMSKEGGNNSFQSQYSKMDVMLENQLLLQEEFQTLLFAQQHPQSCSASRILMSAYIGPLDGLTLEFRMMARFLQTALATNRTLVVPRRFQSAYAPPGCKLGGTLFGSFNHWDCLYERITNCTEDSATISGESVLPATINAAVGIIDHDSVAHYFSPKFYGEQRVISEYYGNPNADVIEHWERAMGRFWIRSQCSHALWKPSHWLSHQIESRLPKSLFQPIVPYIGMHIRFSDNVQDFEKDFSRLANITRDFNNFLMKANEIRKDTGITTIYLATDYAAIIDALSNEEKNGFTFYFQPDALRTYTKDHLWFKASRDSSAASVATDVEVLRRADYLIGSFQSNVYRLAVELNTAYHAGKYLLTMHRHRTVDIEWYEEP